MAYFRKIAEAESCLSRGDLLGAETLLDEARALHAGSRFRAPLVEQAIDPVLRFGRRLLRRSGDGPILPNFPARAESLEQDLRRLAARRMQEASDLAMVEAPQLLPEHRRACESFLLLHRESRRVQLPNAIVWALMRLYLEAAPQGFQGVEADLVPAVFDVPEDERSWLAQWIQAWLLDEDGRVPRLALAILAWCEHFASDSTSSESGAAIWCWLASRLSVLGAGDGPRALRWGRLALELPLAEEEAWSNLRLVASLECNHGWVATSGIAAQRNLERLGRHPVARGRTWPPPELDAVLRARRPAPESPGVVVATAGEGGRRLLLLRTHRERPVDAVFLELADPGRAESRSPFAVSAAQGREAVESWLHPGDVLLVDRGFGDAIDSFLPPERLLAVEELEAVFPHAEPGLPAPPAATHPLFQSHRSLEDWSPLYAAARELLPRARARLRSEALRSGWGRENLRRLSAVGLRRCQTLRRLLDILEPEVSSLEPERLQELPLEPALRWPVLAERPWLESAPEPLVGDGELQEDLVIAHRPEVDELAVEALAMAPVLVVGPEGPRLRALAAQAAASLDPRRVTWQRHRESCPRVELECLGRWIDEAVSRPQRELDVLWLYQGLCATPEAAVAAGLDPEQRAEAWGELEEARDAAGVPSRQCEEGCGLRDSEHGCWPHQLQERRLDSRVWCGDLEIVDAVSSESLLVDDLAVWVDAPDPRVLRHLEGLRRRLQDSRCFLVHADAGPFGESLAGSLAPWLPVDRRPLPHTRAWTHSIDVLAVPAGYAPGEGLFAEEAELLLAERLRLWEEEVGPSPRWSTEEVATGSGLRGRADAPSSKVVLVPRLGAEGELPALVQLLRLALASSHASQSLVCLDPRLADAHPQLLRRVQLPTSLGLGARALASGAEIFGLRGSRTPDTWMRPLRPERLAATCPGPAVEGDRLEKLSRALGDWASHPRLALAAATDTERMAVARLLLALARSSRDGAGLGIRRVVWVGEGVGPFDEAGDVGHFDPEDPDGLDDRIRGVVIAPHHLAAARNAAWPSSSTHTAWLLANAELHLHDGRLGRGCSLPPLDGETRLLAFHDDPQAVEVPSALSAHAVEMPVRAGDWTWTRHRLPDQTLRCPSCGAETMIEHPMSLCQRCGRQVLGPDECEAVSRQQRVAGLREQLAAGPMECLVVSTERAQRDELRHQLGLAILDEEEGNLWGGRSTREAFGYDVVGLDELCGRSTPESRLLLDHLPSDVRLVRALVLRLTAAGWDGIHLEVLDHPLQWHSERPLRRDAPADAWSELAGRQLRWEASRAEVEFRYSQALSDLRRELHRLGHGGRGSFFADASVRRSNGPHAALLEALHTDDPGRTTILAEDAELFARAALWISDTLERAHQCGLSLDPPRSARLLLSELDTTPLLARRMALLLAWARRERLLSATEARSPDHAPGLGLSERLRRARRDEALELGLEDLTIPSTDGDTLRPSADDDGGLAPGDYLSLAATGRSEALQEVARRRAEAGDRVLCIVPETGALRGWADVAHRVPDLELMTAAEVAVAILSELVPDAEGACPRPLPPAGSVAGEEIRQGLLKEVSRLYAQRSGRVPALDSRALRRLLEEEGAVERMASAGGDVAVDTEVLRDCIRQARQRHGWLEERDLFAVAAEKMADDQDLAQKWRRHFDCVLVDDAHGLEDAAAELMHRVFMGIPRWTMSDPWLLGSDEAMQPFRKGRAPSRVPRNIAAAMETVARNQPVAGWKFRSARSNGKGELRRERVLNLEACVRHIRDFAGDHDPTETSLGVVLGHENDRRQVMLRLREAGYRVWDADVVSRYAAPGPRELLALGFLVFEKSLDDDQRAGLMDVVLGNTRWDFSDLPRGGGLELEVTGLADCVAAAVHALVDFADAERPLREFCERARNAGLLDTTLSRASSRHRLEDFLTLVGSRPWFDLRHQIDVAALDGSQGGTGAIWCLRPRDLHGRRFDHVFHICTGFEEASRHLLVASRARRSVTALYSETDPYPRNP